MQTDTPPCSAKPDQEEQADAVLQIIQYNPEEDMQQKLKISQFKAEAKKKPRNLLCPRPLCGRFYSSESALRNHIRLKHQFRGLKPKRQLDPAKGSGRQQPLFAKDYHASASNSPGAHVGMFFDWSWKSRQANDFTGTCHLTPRGISLQHESTYTQHDPIHIRPDQRGASYGSFKTSTRSSPDCYKYMPSAKPITQIFHTNMQGEAAALPAIYHPHQPQHQAISTCCAQGYIPPDMTGRPSAYYFYPCEHIGDVGGSGTRSSIHGHDVTPTTPFFIMPPPKYPMILQHDPKSARGTFRCTTSRQTTHAYPPSQHTDVHKVTQGKKGKPRDALNALLAVASAASNAHKLEQQELAKNIPGTEDSCSNKQLQNEEGKGTKHQGTEPGNCSPIMNETLSLDKRQEKVHRRRTQAGHARKKRNNAVSKLSTDSETEDDMPDTLKEQ